MPAETDPPARFTEYVALDELRPDSRNPKAHDLPAIRASIEARGVVGVAAVIDERTGKLIAGHGRREVLLDLRDEYAEEGKPPPPGVAIDGEGRWTVLVGRGWASKNAKDARAHLVSDNQTTIAGGWDNAPLLAALDGLPEALLGTTGFTADDVDDLRALIEEVDPDPDEVDAHRGAGGTGATGREPSMGERLEGYRDRTVRSIVLDYDLVTFAWLVEHTPAARQALGVDSNADLLVALLAGHLGVAAPDPAAPEAVADADE